MSKAEGILSKTRSWIQAVQLFQKKPGAGRILVVCVSLLLLFFAFSTGSGYGFETVGKSLIHGDPLRPADLIVIENYDPNYLLFERAAQLVKKWGTPHVAIPVQASGRGENIPGGVAGGIVEVMARVARLKDVEMIPVREIEPITLNTALQIRDYLLLKNVASVIFVTSAFRSRRSHLIYDCVLKSTGIQFSTVPVFGTKTPENWTGSWHGMQEVVIEFGKLWYYRLAVLPWNPCHS